MAYRKIPEVSDPREVANPPGPSFSPLVFDNGNPFQMDWLGIGANYMGFAAFPELGLSLAQQTAEFDRAQLSGIKLARTWYGENWARGNPYGATDWSSTLMAAFYTWLSAMQTRGIDVILTMGWHFPGNVAAPTVGGVVPNDTPTPAQETAWAAWVSESLNQMINVRGFTHIKACFFFTEPNGVHTNIPVGYTDMEYYAHLVTIADAKIVADDASRTPIRPRIKLCAAEEFDQNAHPWLDYMRANINSIVDVYTAHSYCSTPPFPPLSLSSTNCRAWSSWKDLFTEEVGVASPKPMWADEGNTLTGGDDDTNGYRVTSDAGLLLARLIDGHAQAGCQSSLFWMLQDQQWVGSVYSQQYGIAKWIGDGTTVKPSWFAVSMLANLTGGGLGTKVHRCASGTTSTLHGTGYFIPYGVRNTVNASGEWSFMVLNEGSATPIRMPLNQSIGGRTVYRYVYSAEKPYTVTAPGLLPWDQVYTNVTTEIPGNIVPGRSVVVYSTMNISAPTAQNLALQAAASATSTAYGNAANLTSGNFSNVIDTANTWRKATDASQAVTLQWSSQQTFSRVELAFCGNTTGQVWANWDTSTPTVLADYVLQYLNASGVWTTLATVTGNTSPNKTHTFAAVTTSGLRLNVTSAAASANVNQIGVYAS